MRWKCSDFSHCLGRNWPDPSRSDLDGMSHQLGCLGRSPWTTTPSALVWSLFHPSSGCLAAGMTGEKERVKYFACSLLETGNGRGLYDYQQMFFYYFVVCLYGKSRTKSKIFLVFSGSAKSFCKISHFVRDFSTLFMRSARSFCKISDNFESASAEK